MIYKLTQRFACLLLIAFCTSMATSSANELVIADDEPIENILPYLTPTGASPRTGSQGQLLITNHTLQTMVWRFSTELLRPASFDFYLIDGEQRQLVFEADYPQFSPLARISHGRVISSTPVIISPGRTVTLLVQFHSTNQLEYFPVAFMSEEVFLSRENGTAYLHGWYLGVVLVLTIYFIVYSLALSSLSARLYAIYFLILSALTFHSFGYSEILFADKAELFYFPVFRSMQIALFLSYLVFAMAFVRARHEYPLLYRFAWFYLMLAIVIFIVIESLEYRNYFIFLVDALAAGFIGKGVYVAYIAVRDGIGGARLFAAGFAVLLLNGAINYACTYLAFAAYNTVAEVLTLSLQAIDALIFAAAIAIQTRQLRRDRDEAMAARLVEVQKKLEVSEQLRVAQIARDKAKTLAEQHRSRFASASHDLRQPLVSLKLAVEDSAGLESDIKKRMTAGLNYLDDMLGDSLDVTRPEHVAVTGVDDGDFDEEIEVVPLQLVFDNLQRMFKSEADAKGLSLRIVKTSLCVQGSTIALIRILSNLVSNSIKFTDSGSVLLGARRCSGKITLQVWDTGCGIETQELERVIQPYERVDQQVKGHGLGLDIVHKLAALHGLVVKVNSRVRAGTVVSVSGLVCATVNKREQKQ
ncbi:MAG: sensor histidine kinase [Granulosicoccus sp.]